MPLRYGKAVNGPLNKPSYVTLIKVKSSCNSVEVTGTATKAAERHHLVFLFVGGALAAVAAVALGVAVVLHMYKRRRRCSYNYTRSPRSRKGSLGPTEEISPQLFSYDQLRRATDGFKEELGRGSFGAVYKGAIGGNGETRRLVAVKRLEKVIEEGEREFLTEMRSIGRTHHRNLVRLLGVCHEGQTRLLVYEYMSNGSLASFIFKKVDDDRPRLRWNERVRIAVDVARGILYLHQDCEPHIIHCDIKPQNILMDASRTAKICDFGLAKLLGPDQTRTFTAVRGTRGYLAPEWYKNAPISVKADVYSFGMVLLETICCRKNLDVDVPDEEMILSEWVYRCFREGQLSKLLKEEEEDGEEVEKRVLERMVKVALWCIQEEPALRPTMKMVMAMLEGNLETPIPPPPDSRES
ncbi:hypothetical protein H6P81_000588 [Aristolochia fimbriata]|uniref:non-specific serine/threonine protein kinase n=1 Tax=Aristolochia fimbriata TaxID=158543 RepID=A0AAV7F4K1_ARIFI|nr:hypothetical protein H6P81_000588 [Aristolochia fimbriata]